MSMPSDAKRSLTVRVPGFVADREVGLGELIKRATSTIGLRPCTGCQQRAARLDKAVTLRGSRHRG